MKTNKSFSKRIKITKSGKLLARKQGQNHYNAKESGSRKMAKKGRVNFNMGNKESTRFLVNIK